MPRGAPAGGWTSVLALVLALGAHAAGAQIPGSGSTAGVADLKHMQATRRPADASLDVNGRLDDAAWRTASFVSDFTQRDPEEGTPATERTEIAVLYDDDALYIGARLHSAHPDQIAALVSRRDKEGNSEQLIVSLDTYHDRRTAYTFAVNAAGVRLDYYHGGDAEGNRDYLYDPVWEAQTAIDATGWTAEMRIPWSQLRFNAGSEQTWGINIVRLIPESNERDYWVLVRRSETGWSSRMGELNGIRDVRPSRRMEMLPYVAGDTRLKSTVNAANPFDSKHLEQQRVGGDLKIGVGPNATLEATFNPDFGQVEADPAEVNLSAFETFFPERRLFFTEGTQLLNGRGNFYSRRIGAPPPIRPPGTFADMPTNSTILGAAKLTGRTPSGLSIGALTAVTSRETARTFDTTTSTFSRGEAAPRTIFGVGVVQQEFGRDNSTAYAMLTVVDRDLEPGSAASRSLARRAYTGLVDGRLRWSGGKYDLNGYVGFSRVEGDTLAITAQQTSSRRYYQRPDADYIDVVTNRKSLNGVLFGINHSKISGTHWLWDVDLYGETPGWELNDMGRLGSGDDAGATSNLRYRETTPGRRFRSYEFGVSTSHEWNFGWDHKFSTYDFYSSATLANYWRVSGDLFVQPRGLSDDLARGGPLVGTNKSKSGNINLSSRAGARTEWNVHAYYQTIERGGRTTQFDVSATTRPGPQLEVSLSPSYSGGVTARQFVTSRATTGGNTFGRRYIFAYVRRDQVSMRLRINYALTPNLTLETLAEPFTARGQFRDFGELAAPRRRDLRRYGTDGTTISAPDSIGRRTVTDGAETFVINNSDFNNRSFRSNAVIRWEWRPGSTLFFVWQQDRGSSQPDGGEFAPAALWDGLSARGTQFFAVKVSYWIPVR